MALEQRLAEQHQPQNEDDDFLFIPSPKKQKLAGIITQMHICCALFLNDMPLVS